MAVIYALIVVSILVAAWVVRDGMKND